MCSIHGFIRLHTAPADIDLFEQLLRRGSDRGRDSFGWSASDGSRHRKIGSSADGSFPCPEDDVRWVVANCRAEPTTEFVADKTLDDVQPFRYRFVSVAHNGTIANDAALEERYGTSQGTRIDSRVLAPLVAAHARDDVDELARVLREDVEGSFALAAAFDDSLILATNYKPLAYWHDRDADVVYFTSLEEYGAHVWPLAPRWTRMDPYSMLLFGPLGVRRFDLGSTEESRSSLVVASGGMDSTVAATMEQRAGRDVTLLHFEYGCRASLAESIQVHEVALALDVPVQRVNLPTLFTQVIGGSPLTRPFGEVADGEAGAEFAHEWVPARNLIMLSIAVGIAEARGIPRVVLGNNLEEAGAYPDNEMAFIDRLNDVLPYATAQRAHVHLAMPVGNLMKHEIVKLGYEIGAPMHLTWSCYESGTIHCGKCGPCYMRRVAHKMHGLEDTVEYRETP